MAVRLKRICHISINYTPTGGIPVNVSNADHCVSVDCPAFKSEIVASILKPKCLELFNEEVTYEL